MKRKLTLGIASLVAATSYASAQGLYYSGSEAQESMPLRWVVGANLIWDDNVTPGLGEKEDSLAVNPYIGMSLVNITPQTTMDVYARLGVIYYFDEPSAMGSDDLYTQARAGFNLTHRFSERLRVSSRNFVSYELEPDYSHGFATTRQIGEYLYWQTDNSVGFRWTERLGSYTGFQFTSLEYDDVANADRFTWGVYHQFRYLLTPQTVLTMDYRYSETDGDGLAADSSDHYWLLGAEHRFNPSTILIARAGAQIHEVDGGEENTNPFVELALNTQMNEQFRLRSFARYSTESYDTVLQPLNSVALYDFDERQTLRIGVSGEYAVSPTFSVFGGVDYIKADFGDGRLVGGFAVPDADGDEDLINAYVGVSMKFSENLYGTASYNYTDSSSDYAGRSYSRNRVTVGVRAEF